MNDGDVKIHVSADADLKKIEEAQQRIKDLHRAADAYEANNKVDMSGAAKSARSEARGLERDVARWTKERASAEKAVTRELAEQDALQKAGVGRRGITMSSLTSAGLGALAGDVFSSVIDQFAAGEALTNRRRATAAGNERQFGIMSSLRGTSGQMVADSWATEDRMAERERERPQLQTDQKFGTINAAGEGAAWGAGIGAAVGSIVPVLGTAVGAGIGAAVGAAVKGVPAYLQGRNKLNQHDQDQAQDAEKLRKENEEAPKKFLREEGGFDLDKLRQRSKRTLEGSQRALVDDMAKQWLSVNRDVYSKSKDKSLANEMADLTVKNELRDRQAMAGAGLVDARSGGAGIAAAARWATGSTVGWEKVAEEIKGFRGDTFNSNQDARIEKHSK